MELMSWLPQSVTTVIALAGLGIFWSAKFGAIDSQLLVFHKTVVDIDKKLSLIERDVEVSRLLIQSLNDITARLSKNSYDIDNCFDKIRSCTNKNTELEALVRSRTHYLTNCLQNVAGKLILLHGEEGEIKFPDMP